MTQGCWIDQFGGGIFAAFNEAGSQVAVATTPAFSARPNALLSIDESAIWSAYLNGATTEAVRVKTSDAGVSSFPLVNPTVSNSAIYPDTFNPMAIAPGFVYFNTSHGGHNDWIDCFDLSSLTDTAQFELTAGTTFRVNNMAATTDGANLVVTGQPQVGSNPSVYIVRLPANTVVPITITPTGTPTGDVVINSANTLAYVSTGNGVTVIDIASATVVATISAAITGVFGTLGIDPTGSWVIKASSAVGSSNLVYVINAGTNTVAATLASTGVSAFVARPNVDPTYAFVMSESSFGTGTTWVNVVEYATQTIVDTVTLANTGGGWRAAVTLDGAKLFVPSDYGASSTLYIVDTAPTFPDIFVSPANDSYFPIPGPLPVTVTIGKLFIPQKGTTVKYLPGELEADWLSIEHWANTEISAAGAPQLFIPRKTSSAPGDELTNWIAIEEWSQVLAKALVTAGVPAKPVFIPRKTSQAPIDRTANFLAVQDWANGL